MEINTKRGGARPGSGRPRKQEPSKIISLRLHPAFYEVLAGMAKRAGMPTARFMQHELQGVALRFSRSVRRRRKPEPPVIDV